MGLAYKKILSNVDKLISVLVLIDDDVEPQNRVTLSALNSDEHGPVAKVEFPGARARRAPSPTASPWRARPAACSEVPAPRRSSG
jgi:hypothetical protein